MGPGKPAVAAVFASHRFRVVAFPALETVESVKRYSSSDAKSVPLETLVKNDELVEFMREFTSDRGLPKWCGAIQKIRSIAKS